MALGQRSKLCETLTRREFRMTSATSAAFSPQLNWIIQDSLSAIQDRVEVDGRNLMRVRVGQLEPNSLTRDRGVPQSAPGRREHSHDEARIKLRSRRLE